MADESVIEIVKRYLRQLRASGLPVTRAVLFGSQARGSAQFESDIDVLLLSPAFEDLTLDQETLAWHVAHIVDWRIEPILCGEASYIEDDWHPLLLVAKQEGIEVPAEEID